MEQVVDLVESGACSAKPYAVDKLQAMTWCRHTWDDIPARTISNCFRHTGIMFSNCFGDPDCDLPDRVDSAVHAITSTFARLSFT